VCSTRVLTCVTRGGNIHAATRAQLHLDNDDVHLIDVQRLGDLLPAEADLSLVPGPWIGVQPAAGHSSWSCESRDSFGGEQDSRIAGTSTTAKRGYAWQAVRTL